MFDFNYEKKIRDLIDKFGLTEQEAESFLKQSEEWFGLKQLLSDKKLRKVLTLIAILFGLIIVTWFYNKLTKNE